MSARRMVLSVTLGGLWAPALFAQASFTMVDLGVVPGGSGAGTTAVEMNAAGDCVGWSTVVSAPHAFLYTDEQGLVDLGNLPGNVSALARAVNDEREVVGESTFEEWRWSPDGGLTPYAPAFWTRPSAVNNAGMIVGTLDPGTFNPSPFLYTPSGGLVQFAGAVWGNAYDVNQSGTVVGDWGGTAGSTYDAVNGSQPLPALPGYPWNAPVAINDLGQVAGNASPVVGFSTWFRYTPGIGIVDIGKPGPWGGGVLDMNDSGDMVGFHDLNPDRAILYTDAQGFQDLNDLVPVGSGYSLLSAVAINDAGQILCQAYHGGLGGYRAVRLDPVTPEKRFRAAGGRQRR